MKNNKIFFSWIGLLLSGSLIVYFILISIKTYSDYGYVLNYNTISSKLVIGGFVVMILVFIFFMFALNVNKNR